MNKKVKKALSWNAKCLNTFKMCVGLLGWNVVRTHLPTQETWETRVPSPRREDPVEEGMATHSSILAWKIPWLQERGGLQSTGLQRVGHNWSDWVHALTRKMCVDSWRHYSTDFIVWVLLKLFFSRSWCFSTIFFFLACQFVSSFGITVFLFL